VKPDDYEEDFPQAPPTPSDTRTESDGVLFILIAPNVSEQMGGEGIKALQIFQELKRMHPRAIQITHARNRDELSGRLKLNDVHYVEDSWVDKLMWRSIVLRFFMDWRFGYKAVQQAERVAREMGVVGRSVVIWQTEPNSPVTPRVVAKEHINCFGPINGNIYYPSVFRQNEKPMPKLRRVFHMPIQRLNRILFRGLTKADLIFCAGGDRTRVSLVAAGCPADILRDSLDCGVKQELLDQPRVRHREQNTRFIHFGRLVFLKGTFLIIQSMKKTARPITLDVVGRGPELAACKQLVEDLDLTARVNFLDWYDDHSELFESFSKYRGFVLPSLEDANGIVVQEAMAMGLPSICLDWGGPQLLVEHEKTGFLVEPISVDYITDKLAEYMVRLADDGELAERMSIRARQRAEEWRWPEVMRDWCQAIEQL